MFQYAKLLSAGALWMLAVTLMVVADFSSVSDLRAWAILASIIAWVPTQALLLRHQRKTLLTEFEEMLMVERRRTERLVQAFAVEMAEGEVPRITPHSRV